MPYSAGYGRDALKRFEALSPILASRVYEAIERLCEAPTSLSRPSSFPHPLHFQLFETRVEHDGDIHLLKVFFHYDQDEQALLIDDFTLTRIG